MTPLDEPPLTAGRIAVAVVLAVGLVGMLAIVGLLLLGTWQLAWAVM